jgi:hypothetical protein
LGSRAWLSLLAWWTPIIRTRTCRSWLTARSRWIDLPPGEYVANAVLLGPDGRERTTEVDMEPFTIYGDDEFVVPIDFPARSFY